MLCLSLGTVLGPLLASAIPAQLSVPSESSQHGVNALLQKRATAPADSDEVAASTPLYRGTDVAAGTEPTDQADEALVSLVEEIVEGLIILISQMVDVASKEEANVVAGAAPFNFKHTVIQPLLIGVLDEIEQLVPLIIERVEESLADAPDAATDIAALEQLKATAQQVAKEGAKKIEARI